MRLHHLEVQAFGPFAGTVSVDFDELSEAGLFLLSGATGAGKTSVLDAVCFALYGDVPGDRSAARRLRSDQADPDLAPRVTLEATLSGRRFRLVRSPAWERAKRRGDGITTEPAKVTISEQVSGAWQPLSSRIDETADLVRRLLGLDQTQFTQVAMLPQGRFQAFLRARSDERHKLLQQLFRTGRFEDVERWLRDRRLALGRSDAEHHQRLADVVSRASEAAAAALPDGVDVHHLAEVADDGRLREWLVARHDAADDERVAARRRTAVASRRELAVRRALEVARAEGERRQRVVEARTEHTTLLGRTAEHLAEVARLDGARRATAVVPWQRQHTVAAARAEQAVVALGEAQQQVAALLGDVPEIADLPRLADDALAAAAVATALRPQAERLAALEHRVVALVRERDRLHTDLERVQGERAVRPDRLEQLRAEVITTEQEAARTDALTLAAQAARTRLDSHQQVAALEPRLHDARVEWLAAREETLLLKEALVSVRLARIDGMAAELAVALAAGGSCPVCGSHDHPSKARPAAGAADAAAEKSALAAVDDAAILEHALDQQVRDLEQGLAAARARAGEETPEMLTEQLGRLQESLAAALQASGRLPDLLSRRESDTLALADLDRRADTLIDQLNRVTREHADRSAEAAELRAEVELALDGYPDAAALEAAHRRTAALCREAGRAAADADEAVAAQDQAATGLADAAAEAGFDDVPAALAAVLDQATTARLAERVEQHRARLAAVTEVLRDVPADDGQPLPDVAALTATHETALGDLGTARAELALLTARTERLGGLLGELDAALAAWAPLRHDLAVTTRLSTFVEGRSPDNQLRMRLSAYVLAYRLSQVVDAANERLAGMSDQRYSLEHTGRRGAGETRGGLSLLVRDDWSGESRDPATLSGGETFVVSLALALGLADVIAHEAGGAALDTLFVDEGFGSLDADTLDDVMDTLDALRDGGRVVGVVSHVAEMRDRIPTQLVVTKSRTGSTVALRR